VTFQILLPAFGWCVHKISGECSKISHNFLTV
jgi:hypothetical protein